MIYFTDDLRYTQAFRINSDQRTIEIWHSLDEDEDNETNHDIIITSASRPGNSGRAGEIRLLSDGKTPLSDIAKAAMACIYNDSKGEIVTPLEFLRNYKSILLGESTEWKLKEIAMNPRSINLKYFRKDDTEDWGCISFTELPFDLVFDVPCQEDMVEGDETEGDTDVGPGPILGKLADLWRNRDDAIHGISTPAEKKQFQVKQVRCDTERVVIHYNPDKERTEIWVGQVGKGIDDGLQPGQKMLSVEYDDCDDIIVTRHYHEQDCTGDRLEQLLNPRYDDQIFCL